MQRHLTAALCLLIVTPAVASAWGDDGHLIVNEAAARGIPADMPDWIRTKVQYLAYLGPEPDRWRNRDQRELNQGAAADHFIDLEWAEAINPKSPPKHRHDYAREIARSRKRPDKVGYGPYRVIELCQKLEASVASLHVIRDTDPHAKERRKAARHAVLYTAGVLGHYVADLSNPHHCTLHYNGWKGENPKGFPTDSGTHARFESVFVKRIKPTLKVVVSATANAKLDYARAIWDLILESNGLTEHLYTLDRDGAFTEGNEQSAIGGKGKAFAESRMRRAATLLRDMWATAFARGKTRAKVKSLQRDLREELHTLGLSMWPRVNFDLSVEIKGKVSDHGVTKRVRAMLRRYPQITRIKLELTVLY